MQGLRLAAAARVGPVQRAIGLAACLAAVGCVCEPNWCQLTTPPRLAVVAARSFDPAQFCLRVDPIEATGPICSSQVLMATITDPGGLPVAGERVEWTIERGSVGEIVAVDQHGIFPGSGGKLSNTCAVSFTNYRDCRLTRSTPDPSGGICIRPGQTCCIITSAVEGETVVFVRAPCIRNSERKGVIVTRHWIDATVKQWITPDLPINGKAGSASLAAQVNGPSRATAGDTVTYEIVITNAGSGTARNVQVVDIFDERLQHETGEQAVQHSLEDLPAHDSRKLNIELRGTVAGRLCQRIEVTGDGSLSATAEACTTFVPPKP